MTTQIANPTNLRLSLWSNSSCCGCHTLLTLVNGTSPLDLRDSAAGLRLRETARGDTCDAAAAAELAAIAAFVAAMAAALRADLGTLTGF